MRSASVMEAAGISSVGAGGDTTNDCGAVSGGAGAEVRKEQGDQAEVASAGGDTEQQGTARKRRRVVDEACGACSKPAKYRCPACGFISCSLQCSTRHKTERQCSGKRNRTPYVAIGQFNDTVVRDDYGFLEDTLRAKDSAHRALREFGTMRVRSKNNRGGGRGRGRGRGGRGGRGRGGGSGPTGRYQMPQLPRHLHLLLRYSRLRGVHLRLMPQGMSRHDRNTSRVVGRDDDAKVFWRTEWVFPAPTEQCDVPRSEWGADAPVDVKVVDEQLDEECVLGNELRRFVEPQVGNSATRHRLKAYCAAGVDALRVYLRRPHFHRDPAAEGGAAGAGQGDTASKAQQEAEDASKEELAPFFEMDKTKSLRENLAGRSVAEFPTLFVALPGATAAFEAPVAPVVPVETSSSDDSSSSDDDDSDGDEAASGSASKDAGSSSEEEAASDAA